MNTVTFTYFNAKCKYNFETENLHIISKHSFNSPNQTNTDIISRKHNIEKKDIKTITFKHPNTKLPSHIFNYFSNYQNLEFIELESLNFKNVETVDGFITNCPKLKEIIITNKKAENLTSIDSFIGQTRHTRSIKIKNINIPNLQKIEWLLWLIEGDIKEITIENITAPNIKTVNHLIDNSTIKTLDLTKIGNVNITSIETLIRNCINLETLEIKPLKNTIEIEAFIKKAPLLNTEIINKINKIEKLDTYFLTMTPKIETLDLDKFKDISELSSHLEESIFNDSIYPSIKIGRHKLKFSEYSIILENNIHIIDKTENEIVKEIITEYRNETKENIEDFLKTLEDKKIFKNKKCKQQLTSKLTIIKNLK